VGVVLPNGTVNYNEEVLNQLPTAGGVSLRIEGRYFGPPSPGFVEGAYGVGSTRGSLSATHCVVKDSSQQVVECTLEAGVGAGFRLVVAVGGQRSAPSAATLSFGPPYISASIVAQSRDGGVPTAGGTMVTLMGTNLGAAAADVQVMWNGEVVLNAYFRQLHSAIAVTAPVGEGEEVRVVVTVAGQASNQYRLTYSSPVVTRLSVVRSRLASSMDCSLVGSDGRPVGSGAVAGNATVVLTGENFGLGPHTAVTIGGVECKVAIGDVSHDRILCVTPMCRGTW
jgi:hypothetical protein